MEKSYNIRLTDLGAQLLNEANANQTVVNITQIAIGDGGGAVIDEVDLSRTELVREFGRQVLDAGDGDQSFISGTITVNSSDYGGQAIREVGLIDENGNLIAYSDYPESMIPTAYALSQGFTMQIVITLRMLIVNAENAVMVIDENTATATKFELAQAIEEGFAEHKAEEDPHSQYALFNDLLNAIPNHEQEVNPHSQYTKFSDFNQKLSTNGYLILPTGLIIQWGNGSCSGTLPFRPTTPFNIVFPNSVLNVTGQIHDNTSGSITSFIIGLDGDKKNSSFVSQINGTGTNVGIGFYWVAIGY